MLIKQSLWPSGTSAKQGFNYDVFFRQELAIDQKSSVSFRNLNTAFKKRILLSMQRSSFFAFKASKQAELFSMRCQ